MIKTRDVGREILVVYKIYISTENAVLFNSIKRPKIIIT